MRNKKDINGAGGVKLLKGGARKALVHELNSMEDVFRRAGEPGNSTSLALVRLVPHMNLNEWKALNGHVDPSIWRAVEVPAEGGVLGALLNFLQHDPSPEYRIDPVGGALLEIDFMRRLAEESARARRGKYELSVGVFAVDNIDGIYASHGQAAARETLMNLIALLRGALEPCDGVGRLAGGEYAVVMPGAGIFKMRHMAEDILNLYRGKSFSGPSGSFRGTLSAGLACGQGQNAGQALLDGALKAMRQAAGQGGDKAEINRRDMRCFRDNSVLVCSNEKRFLFSGTDS